MKYSPYLLLIFFITSCSSSQKVAEYRNAEFSHSNNYEVFKFWRELDIRRLEDNLLNVKIGVAIENSPISSGENQSYFKCVIDSIQVQIGRKNQAFQDFKVEYIDTTEQERLRKYKHLQSDSADFQFLARIERDPYYELYKSLINRTSTSIQRSSFYTSHTNFEDYIANRSFMICDWIILKEIFGADALLKDRLSDHHRQQLQDKRVNFLILFSISFATDFSEEAWSRIGSERITLKLIDVNTGELITTSETTHYWGDNPEDNTEVKNES